MCATLALLRALLEIGSSNRQVSVQNPFTTVLAKSVLKILDVLLFVLSCAVAVAFMTIPINNKILSLPTNDCGFVPDRIGRVRRAGAWVARERCRPTRT